MNKINIYLSLVLSVFIANIARGELPNTKETIVDVQDLDVSGLREVKFYIGSMFEVDKCNVHKLNGGIYRVEYDIENNIIIKVKTEGLLTSTAAFCTDSTTVKRFIYYPIFRSLPADKKVKIRHPEKYEVRYSIITESALIDPNNP